MLDDPVPCGVHVVNVDDDLGHRRVGATRRIDRVCLADADPDCAHANGRIPRRPVASTGDLKAQSLVERRRDFHVCGKDLNSQGCIHGAILPCPSEGRQKLVAMLVKRE
jgi:hypothetical protein